MFKKFVTQLFVLAIVVSGFGYSNDDNAARGAIRAKAAARATAQVEAARQLGTNRIKSKVLEYVAVDGGYECRLLAEAL